MFGHMFSVLWCFDGFVVNVLYFFMCFYIPVCNCFTVTATKCFHSKPLWFLKREKTVTRILFAQLYHWDTATLTIGINFGAAPHGSDTEGGKICLAPLIFGK